MGGRASHGHMGAVLTPLFAFFEPGTCDKKNQGFLWSRKIRESTSKGPAKG